jgi:hypothetical protein
MDLETMAKKAKKDGERMLRKLFSFVENMFNFFQVIENAIEEDDDDDDDDKTGGYMFK